MILFSLITTESILDQWHAMLRLQTGMYTHKGVREAEVVAPLLHHKLQIGLSFRTSARLYRCRGSKIELANGEK